MLGVLCVIHLIDVECREHHDTRICYSRPWSKIVERKLNSIPFKPSLLATKISLIRLLVLKLIAPRAFNMNKQVIIWGFIGNDNVGNITFIDLSEEDWFSIYSSYYKLPKFVVRILAEIERALLYMIVGASGIIVNLSAAVIAYNSMSSGLGIITGTIASTIGFEASIAWNFTLHELITFKGYNIERSRRAVFTRLIKYHFASITSWVCQASLATFLPSILGIKFWIAQLIGIIIGFTLNFILGYMYTWSRSSN